MTPKEKAIELLDKFYQLDDVNGDVAIKCAIILIDDIVNELQSWGAPYLYEDSQSNDNALKRMVFLQEVKQELEKML